MVGNQAMAARPMDYATALRASPRAFGLNLLLLLVLHVLPPIGFFVPVFTGFIAGSQIRARPPEAAVLGLSMGGLMFGLCSIVGVGFIILFPEVRFITVVIVASVLVVHLAAFAAIGAVIGGHYARKDEPARVGPDPV